MPRPSEPPSPVVFTPAAANDLAEAFAYITPRNASASRGLLARLRDGVERLKVFPLLGSPLSAEELEHLTPGIRFVVVEPYLVFYRVQDPDVVILRILHSRRDSLGELFEEP